MHLPMLDIIWHNAKNLPDNISEVENLIVDHVSEKFRQGLTHTQDLGLTTLKLTDKEHGPVVMILGGQKDVFDENTVICIYVAKPKWVKLD